MELCINAALSTRRPDKTRIPFAECVALARSVGFTQMDFGISTDLVADDTARAAAFEMQKIAADGGITFRYAHLPYNYPGSPEGWPAFDTATRRAMELAVELGVECAAIHPCTAMTRDYDHDAFREASLTFLRPYAEYAKQLGLTLALENMRGAGRSADPAIRRYATDVNDVWELADTLDTGICWDTGHGNISMQNAYESMLLIAPRLKMLHVNDNFGEDDVHTAPYTGTTDWAGLARGLKEIGFQGAINLEVGANRLPLELRPTYAKYLAESATMLRSAIQE